LGAIGAVPATDCAYPLSGYSADIRKSGCSCLVEDRQSVLGPLEDQNLLDLKCNELLALSTLEKRPNSQGHHCWGTGVKRAVFH
jgi:hypothetical protein